MKKFVLIMLMCMGVAYAQIPYNSYPPAGALSGTEKVLINQGNADALYLTTTADIADLFSGSITPTFNNIQSGTNTNTLTIGSGGQLSATGTGFLSANQVNGNPIPLSAALVQTNSLGQFITQTTPLPIAIGGTNGTSALAALNNLLPSQATFGGDCLGTNGTNSSWVTCGSGGGGAFNSLTGGTNTTAAMLVGTGASLAFTGSGILSANQLNGGVIPASAQVLATNGGSQIAALTLAGNLVESGSILTTSQTITTLVGSSYAVQATDAGKLLVFNAGSAVAVTLPAASTLGFTAGFSFDLQNLGLGSVTVTPTTSLINGGATLVLAQTTGCTVTSDGTNYQVSACTAVLSGGGGGGGGAFNLITTGTNTTATMTVGSGATLTTSGTGIIAAQPAMVANTTTDGMFLKNLTATTSGNSQYSPSIHFQGQGWAAGAGASQPADWTIFDLPIQAGTLGSVLVFSSQINGGGYTSRFGINNFGDATASAFTVNQGSTNPSICGTCFYQVASGQAGIGANAVATMLFTSTLTTFLVPGAIGGTAFTVSGCGTAAAVTGNGAAGTFTVGTGASTCTFTFTINGATGMTAAHGWVANVDDITAHLHCTNAAGGSVTTAVVLCNSTVTTADTIAFSAVPY